MGLYVYCFTPAGHGPGPDIAGVAGNPVSLLASGKLALWVDLRESVPDATLRSVKAHHAVVEAAWSTSPACLPARFGQWFHGHDALEESLAEKRPALEQALARVEGAAEHGVRIADPRASTSDEAHVPSGRAYLELLRQQASVREERDRRGEALGVELEAALGDAVREQRSEPLPTRHGLLSVSHLVPRERQQDYVERLGAFRGRHPELRFLTSGPWPPYSFAP